MKSCFDAIASLQTLGDVAQKFLLQFPNGGIFLFPSEMGSGKTTFCRSVIERMGYEFDGSPTFSIANQYRSRDRFAVLHVDLYRVKSSEELIEMGFNDMLTESDFIFIEWPEIATKYFHSNYYVMTISNLDDENRRYECLAFDTTQ